MTAGTSNTSSLHYNMQLNSAIPVPTMVTRSLTPYTGPDHLTSLPTELMQRVASNLDADSIRSLRLTNRATLTKTSFNFVNSCLHTLSIDLCKVGFRRGLHSLQTDFANTATKQVMFTHTKDDNGYIANGSRPNTRINIPSNTDINAVMNLLPRVTNVVIRDLPGQSVVPQSLCHAITVAPRQHLTDLTIDGATITSKVLINFPNAHRMTLCYLVLRNIRCEGPFVKKLLKTLTSSGFGLTRLVIGSFYEGYLPSTKPFIVAPCSTLTLDFTGGLDIYSYTLIKCRCKDCKNIQNCVPFAYSASMTGHLGVEKGIARILKNMKST